MQQMLAGVRVLDMTTVLSGPFAAYQLSLFGAEVIKVELPVIGDLAREIGDDDDLHVPGMGASFLAQNAGKRSITVDLKSRDGSEIFERLIRSADVLVENMRPKVLARLGFSWERMHELNPRLIYCAVTGFGQDGPLSARPAYDQIIQGLAGMADVTGFPSGESVRVGFPVCDTVGGFAAAMAIAAALVGRSSTGVGTFLDVSMLDTAITAMGWVVSNQLIVEKPATRIGNDNATSAPSGTFQTGLGRLNIAANTQAQFEALCEVCDCVYLVTDERFLTRGDRKRNRSVLQRELERALSARSAEEWETLLSRVSVPAGRVLTVAEALAQQQVVERELVHEVELGGFPGRSVHVLGSGIHINGEALIPSSPPPTLGQHTDEILAELGYSSEETRSLHEIGAV